MSWFVFFNDTATTEIYTLSLHDALPICLRLRLQVAVDHAEAPVLRHGDGHAGLGHRIHGGGDDRQVEADGADRKSTRLNSSHANISYAVFCLKKKIK